jgi:hypothetical protein
MPVATDPMIEKLMNEREQTLSKIEGLKTLLSISERDLTTDELESSRPTPSALRPLILSWSLSLKTTSAETIQARVAMASPFHQCQRATSTALLVSCCGMSSTIGRRTHRRAWTLCSAAQRSTWAPQLATLWLWLVALVGSWPARSRAPLSTWPLRVARGSTSLGCAARLPL